MISQSKTSTLAHYFVSLGSIGGTIDGVGRSRMFPICFRLHIMRVLKEWMVEGGSRIRCDTLRSSTYGKLSLLHSAQKM